MPECPANPAELQAGVAFRDVLSGRPRLASIQVRATETVWRDIGRQELSAACQSVRRRKTGDELFVCNSPPQAALQ